VILPVFSQYARTFLRKSNEYAINTLYHIMYCLCFILLYYQNELESLDSWQISLVMLISSGVNIGAVWLASHLGENQKASRLLPILVALTGLLYIFSFTKMPMVYVLIYLLTDGIYAFFLPIFNNDLQNQIPTDVRATMLSVCSMFFSLSMILVFPMTGLFIDYFGFSQTFLGLGSVLAVLGMILICGHSYFSNDR
ncbi:hypothetical protein ACEE91_10205, partial [Streptococcus orisratti]